MHPRDGHCRMNRSLALRTLQKILVQKTRLISNQYLFNDHDFNLYDKTVSDKPDSNFLFDDPDSDSYDKNDGWKQQQQKLDDQRETAVRKIFQQHGFEGIVKFAEAVTSPHQVGYALGAMEEEVIEQSLLPCFLDAEDNKHQDLTAGFIWTRNQIKGWKWCAAINKSAWTPSQLGQFLAYLPFTKRSMGPSRSMARGKSRKILVTHSSPSASGYR